MQRPRLTVVGSINLDLVVRAERLPRPGETVSGARFSRVPGGKGANQAVAAARLGAEVRMVGCVGRDELADEALAGLREAGVEERWLVKDAPTGIALITVDAAGETTIVVAPGANAELRPEDLDLGDARPCSASRRSRPRRSRGRPSSRRASSSTPRPPGTARRRPS